MLAQLLMLPLGWMAIKAAKRILRMMAETGEIAMPDKVDTAMAAYQQAPR